MLLFALRVYSGIGRRWRRVYYRQILGHMGERCSVCKDVVVTNPGDVHLGVGVTVNDRVLLQACEGAEIHLCDGVVLSFGVMVITGGLQLAQHGVIREAHSSATIRICEGVWIGAGAIVLPGVTIGKGAVVGAGSLVSKDVPENCVAMGVPARVVRKFGVQ